MNPEEQNPATNPVAPTPSSGSTPTSEPSPMANTSTTSLETSGLSPADSLAAAQENLTAAANAATATPDPVATADSALADSPVSATPSDTTNDATASEAETAAIIDEPLVPAAPVPGSIGSVTSVPPVVDNTPAETQTDNAFAAAAAAEPAATPFNPFAQPATQSTPDAAPAAADGVNPVFQPANPTPTTMQSAKKPGMNPKLPTLILGIAAGVFLIATIVLAVLYVNALNNKEIVYYPQVVEPDPVIETLSCTQVIDLGYLASYPVPVNGNRAITVTYTDDALTALTVSYDAVYNNDIDANTALANLQSSQSSLVNTPESSFTANYSVNGATMLADLQSVEDMLTNDAAETLLFGSVSGNADAMSSANLEATLTQAGATCTIE